MIKRLLLSIIAIALIIFQTAKAQDNKNSIEISPFVGLSMFSADNNSMKGTSWGLEGVYHLNMLNNKADWVHMLGIQDVGIGFSYRNLERVYLTQQAGSTGFLGAYYGAVSQLDFLLARLGKTELLLVPGFGFGYATQTYYTNDNPLVGSHINFTAQFGLKLVTPITASTSLVAGIDLYHYSNAAFKLPNEGVNSINASLGIKQDIDVQAPPTSKYLFENYKKSSFEFGADIGRRGLVQMGGGLTSASAMAYQKSATSDLYQSGLYAGYNYRLNPVLSLRGGIDAVYYYKTLDTVSDIHHFYATYQELGSSYDRFRVGASLGTELWLGRFSLPLNGGYYLHYHYFVPTDDHTYSPPNFYWSFGARYYISHSFAIEAKQYLHRTQADFAGFGIIYKLTPW